MTGAATDALLTIRDLSVYVGGKHILKGLDLSIKRGETAVLFGPNGSGKTTLIKTILGLEGYRIAGDIIFKGEAINPLSTDERVHRGIGVMFQHPPAIRGVTLRGIARFLCNDEQRITALADELSLAGLLDRDVNLDFSGGEIKRSELFQLLLQDPELLLLDEPESGVDIENVSVMGAAINRFLRNRGKAGLIITHTGYILNYVEAQRGCVMLEQKFWCMRDPKKIFQDIQRQGYEKCVECHERG